MERKNSVILTSDEAPIIALCTPRGSGAIALLRLCGINAVEIAESLAKLSSGKKLTQASSHTIHHGHVVAYDDQEKRIDEVLFLLMHGPKTFTGQDTIEISCHNNQFIIQQIIEQAILAGARLALPGEFTKRAFLNGKVDLIQAESINELIHAQTEVALKKSMSQLQGSLSSFLYDIEIGLVGLLSVVEGSFEFFEEEHQDLDINKMIKERMGSLMKKLKEMKTNFAQQQQIRQGIKISMIGWVNAGKSTLFNAILKKERAIVTNIEGTTRDSIESSLYRNGNFWMLTDTAGLRQTSDFIEQEGIERSWQQAAQADIILLVIDISKKLTEKQLEIYKQIVEKYQDKTIIVANKLDDENQEATKQLNSIVGSETVKVSAVKKRGIELLESIIENKIQKLFSKLKSPFLLNQRQFNLISELEQNLEFIENNNKNVIQYELIAYHIKEMLEKLSELTGRNVTERVLDRVFNDFCIGK
jgi:tRNA modification GTPase